MGDAASSGVDVPSPLTFGGYVSALVGGACAWLIIAAAIWNRTLGRTALVGWGVPALAAACLTLVCPIALLASAYHRREAAPLAGVAVAAGVGAYLAIGEMFGLGGYSSARPMIAVIIGWSAVALVDIASAKGSLRIALFIAACSFIPVWLAVFTGTTNSSMWFAQAALAAPVGLGAGIGAMAAAAVIGVAGGWPRGHV
jgi:hypothetical protein